MLEVRHPRTEVTTVNARTVLGKKPVTWHEAYQDEDHQRAGEEPRWSPGPVLSGGGGTTVVTDHSCGTGPAVAASSRRWYLGN